MENIMKVSIRTLDLDMASVISQNNREKLFAFLKRMNLEAEIQWDKEVLALILKDALLENPEYVLSIYGKDMIELLIRIWDSDCLELEPKDWAVIGHLKFLGFLDFSFAETEETEGHTIYVMKEAQDAFYYYLKSKTAKIMMERYDTWEVLVRGMMTHYGIISFGHFYYHFSRLIKSPIDDDLFHRFLSVRLGLLSFGGFALDKFSNVEYYQNFEISNPEQVLERRQEYSDLEYYCPSRENTAYLAQNNGIGNWEGISIVAEVFLQLLDIEYYKTVIAIKTCILMAQNDEDSNAMEEYLYQTYPECKKYRDMIHNAVYLLYHSVPVYSLKGWNRKEFRKKQKCVPAFSVIKGGKKELW